MVYISYYNRVDTEMKTMQKSKILKKSILNGKYTNIIQWGGWSRLLRISPKRQLKREKLLIHNQDRSTSGQKWEGKGGEEGDELFLLGSIFKGLKWPLLILFFNFSKIKVVILTSNLNCYQSDYQKVLFSKNQGFSKLFYQTVGILLLKIY